MIPDQVLNRLCRGGPAEERLVYVPITRCEYGDLRDEQFQPASVDVRLSHDLILYDEEPQREVDLRGGSFWIHPLSCVLGSLVERVRVPANMVGWVEGKSSIGRQFMKVHSAGFIDPGFHGDITLELKNESSRRSFELRHGMVIAQLRFAYLDAVAVRPYGTEELGSHYQMQIGTTQAR